MAKAKRLRADFRSRTTSRVRVTGRGRLRWEKCSTPTSEIGAQRRTRRRRSSLQEGLDQGRKIKLSRECAPIRLRISGARISSSSDCSARVRSTASQMQDATASASDTS
jgi:hypothetical protein